VRRARVDQLQWDATGPEDAEKSAAHVWSGPFDSVALLEHEKDAQDTLPAGTKVLGLHAYSDSTILTATGDTLLASCLPVVFAELLGLVFAPASWNVATARLSRLSLTTVSLRCCFGSLLLPPVMVIAQPSPPTTCDCV